MDLLPGSLKNAPPLPFFAASSADPSVWALAQVVDGQATLSASRVSDLSSSSVWYSLAWMPGMSRMMAGVSACQSSQSWSISSGWLRADEGILCFCWSTLTRWFGLCLLVCSWWELPVKKLKSSQWISWLIMKPSKTKRQKKHTATRPVLIHFKAVSVNIKQLQQIQSVCHFLSAKLSP